MSTSFWFASLANALNSASALFESLPFPLAASFALQFIKVPSPPVCNLFALRSRVCCFVKNKNIAVAGIESKETILLSNISISLALSP